MAKSKKKMATVQVAVVRKSVIGFLKYHRKKKKNIEFFKKGKCPSGGRKEMCH